MIFNLIQIKSSIEHFRYDSSTVININDRNYAVSNPLGILSRQLSKTQPSEEKELVKHVSFANNFVCFSFSYDQV